MAVKIPIKMKEDVPVRNMEELKQYFDPEKLLVHYRDGKLQTWLRDRYYEDELDAVNALDRDAPDLLKKLCAVFGEEYFGGEEIDLDAIQRRNERIAKLKQYTADEKIIANVDSVAFNQEELAELYDCGVEKIYLCEGEFRIPKSKQGLEYVVVGSAIVNGLLPKEQKVDQFVAPTPLSPFPSEILSKINAIGVGEDALIYVWCTLNGSVSDMSYSNDNIHSKSEAERKATSLFRSEYGYAKDFFSIYSSHSICTAAAEKLYNLIKNILIETTDTLNNLSEDTRRRNARLLQELGDMIDLETVQNKISEITKNELSDRYYEFPDMSLYTCQIEYTSMEHDPPGLFGKRDWWFDGMSAWLELDQDLTKKAEAYCKYVSNSFRRDIVRPILDMLERIK